MKTLFIAILLLLSACSTVSLRVEDENGGRMTGTFTHNWMGYGEVRFDHTDGETFAGHYSWITDPREFHSRMGAMFGVGKSVGFGASSLTTLFYMADLEGSKGTTATCGYAINAIGNLSYNGTGECLDSKSRKFKMYLSSENP